jgi:hypothetical protein
MHVAATYDGATTRVYVNGIEEGSGDGPSSIVTNATNVGIGAQPNGQRYFQGTLDGVALYDRALTHAEVIQLAEVTCPTDAFEPGTTVCGPAAGDCDLEELCTGSGPSCPADLKSVAECRASADTCDVAEVCDGVSNDCPADAVEPVTTECRASAGVCDLADFCDGVGVACPADAKSSALCRGVAGLCDIAEFCDAVGNDCPADLVVPASTECRASAGVCDVAELCDGAVATCPADGFEPNGTPCVDGTVCNGEETCQSGSCTEGTPLDCDDFDECTAESCDEITGCAHDPIPGCNAVPALSTWGTRALPALLAALGSAALVRRRSLYG